jgi:glycosyltransferase involved in cell wall biosynthesis
MRILMLTYEVINRGGNFIRAQNLARELICLGHEVVLLSGGNKPSFGNYDTLIDGVKVVCVADILPYRFRHDGMSPMQIINRIGYIKNHKFDIIHGFGHRPASSVPAIVARNQQNIPYVADWSDLWGKGGIATLRGGLVGAIQGQIDTIMEKMVYQAADGVTVICRDLYQRLIDFKINPRKILLLPPGGTFLSERLSSKAARLRLGLSPDCQYVVYVGNAPYDQVYLARAMVKLFKINANARMLFAGAAMPKFNQITRSSGFEPRVNYLGFVPPEKLSSVITSGDVMLIPYLNTEINRNRFPNKLGDYLSFGKPTITNATGDIGNLFNKYEIGVLAGDPDDFATQTHRLLADRKRQKILGNNALKLVKTEFSWKNRARSLVKFYERLISEYRSR